MGPWMSCPAPVCMWAGRRGEETDGPRPAEVTLRWKQQLQFEGGGNGRPPILVDGDSRTATSPVETLLVAAATCTASDVLIILQKQRIKLSALSTDGIGTPPETQPPRSTATHIPVHSSAARD